MKVTEIFPKTLKFVIGCGDFIRAARRTDMSAVAYFDRLAGVTGENIVWHRSQDESSNKPSKSEVQVYL